MIDTDQKTTTLGPRTARQGIFEQSIPIGLETITDTYRDSTYRIDTRLGDFGGSLCYAVFVTQDRADGDDVRFHDALFVRIPTKHEGKLRILAKNSLKMYLASFVSWPAAQSALKALVMEVGDELDEFKLDVGEKTRMLNRR